MSKKSRSDYEIGYGKPPVDSQFKPGQSGNPKGRPAGKQDLTARIGKKLAARRSVMISGNRFELSIEDILLERLVNLAAEGDSKIIFKLLEEAQKHRRRRNHERLSNRSFLSSEKISKMSLQEQSDLYLRCVREAHELAVEPPDTDED